MARRARSPFAGMRRSDLRVIRLYVTAAKEWADRLGTDDQSLPPHHSEIVWLEDMGIRELRWYDRAFDRARNRAFDRQSAGQRRRTAKRQNELWEERHDPVGARMRSLRAEIASLRAEVAHLRQTCA